MQDERRVFNRVAFDSNAMIYQQDFKSPCQILDISLKGVLIQLKDTHPFEQDASCKLEILLDDQQTHIRMTLKLVRQAQANVGLLCTNIDLDSITHLRRLVELNLGNSDLLDREFEALCSDG